MLHVQKYLKNHTLDDLKNEFGIHFKMYDDRVLLKYKIDSKPKFHPIVKECRGLILSLPDFSVMSRSFDRFFNLGENLQDSESFNWNNCIIFNKYDGCLDYNTVIETLEHGDLKIGYIVDNKIKCHVKSYDIYTNTIVYPTIDGYSEKDNIDNWYEIEMDNGVKLKVTENHYIYMEKLKCWRKVKDLCVGDDLLIN